MLKIYIISSISCICSLVSYIPNISPEQQERFLIFSECLMNKLAATYIIHKITQHCVTKECLKQAIIVTAISKLKFNILKNRVRSN